MNISVVICTYNRCKSLERALESLSSLLLPMATEWEVLIIDNNSTDNTRSIAESFCERNPRCFRYLFEPRQGKSYALNTAISKSNGEILAFIDDDVTVQPSWLQNLTSVLQSGKYAGSAGCILPAESIAPPQWLALEGRYNMIGAVCPCFDLGPLSHDLEEAPFGANMAFRREMFSKYGAFRVDLGPSSNTRVSSEDIEFGRRLLSRGELLRYVPSAIVYHEIHQDRINKEFFLNWWNGLGRGAVRESNRKLTALQVFKIFARMSLTALQGIVTIDPKRRFYCKCRVWFGAGKLNEALRGAARAKDETNRQGQGGHLEGT